MSVVPEPPAQTSQPWTPVSPGGENQLPVPPSQVPPGGEAQLLEPASSTPDGGADLLGVRTFAALIDLAVLLGLFIVVVVAVGEADQAGDELAVYLDEATAAVYLALVLLYYFALESAFGQTVGRRLLGLRVVRLDGSRRPSRNRGIAATLVAAFVVLVVVVVGQQTIAAYQHRNDARNGVYRAHGVSFNYPVGWQQGEVEGAMAQGGADELWSTAVTPITENDGFDFVDIRAYRLNISMATADDLGAVMLELESFVQQGTEQVGGVVEAGPQEYTMAGLPALQFHITGTVDGTAFKKMLIFAFDGTTEYVVTCTHTPGRFAEIQRGCAQVIRTFTVG